MNPKLFAAIRFAKRLLSLLAVLLVAGVLAIACALHLALTGKSLPLLRTFTAQVGTVFAGQRTEALTVNVGVTPGQGRLAGTATLAVRSLEAERRRFYFLLNAGLHLRQVYLGASTNARTAAAYQLSQLTVVDLPNALPKDATVQLTFDYEGSPAGTPLGLSSNVVNAEQVLLNVDAFWYPSDVQGPFTADVTVTLPADMTVVHNGVGDTPAPRGDVQQVHWTSERPVVGLALVAGRYALSTLAAGDTTYRVYLPDDVHLDPTKVLRLMADADRILTARYGASGFHRQTMFVSRHLRRGFNDGSGVLGLSRRYFRAGDYGFAVIAHEIAHDWWGATVAERWLSPGTGGEWIVEGLAEASSLAATETELGADALTRRLAAEFFDPARAGVVADMSVLDNAVAEATARDTIYRKGAYVATMLRRLLGDDAWFNALQQFLERFRYQQVTDGDLQSVLQQVSGRDLTEYFADWLRSDRLADLSLDAGSQTAVVVNNAGSAHIRDEITLWTSKKNGAEPTRSGVHVGDQLTFDPATDALVLDPQLLWADVQRENNRYPRRLDPVYVDTAAGGRVAVTQGELFPWVRATVSSRGADGRTEHTWDFERGLAAAPAWSPDSTRLIVSYADAHGTAPAIVALAADGTRRTIGRGSAPVAAADGSIYAGRQDRIVRFAADGRESTVVHMPGATLDAPLPSPDGNRLVYTAISGNDLAVRLVGTDGGNDRLLLSWDNDRIACRWSRDGTRLYAIVGGDWDWQVWEIPLDDKPVRILVREAATITDLAVSPAGDRLAFTAAPSLDDPRQRHLLYVMRLQDQAVRAVDLPDSDLSRLAWVDNDSLLVIAAAAGANQPWMLPAARTIKRVDLASGNAEDLQ